MNKVNLKAYAKINLFLEVLNKRYDGYHEIKSVFQRISLYDEINILKINNSDFILETNINEINNENNIIFKAYKEIQKKYDMVKGIKVILKKNIPMQAGLGGGSSNCASFILGINELFNLNMNNDEICAIAKKLGADVVPCLYRGANLVRGIGHIVKPLNGLLNFHLLIIQPDFTNSTKEMYKLIDENGIKQKENDDKLINVINSLKENDVYKLANNLYNVFEDVATNKEKIEEIKKELCKNGALGSMMTGSGSCIFGIFENEKQMLIAFSKLGKKYNTYVAKTIND